MRYKATCPCCKRSSESDNINDCILNINHIKKSKELQCDYFKHYPITYNIEDRALTEE